MALLGLDRAPLVDFCNQGSPRAHPWNRPIFALLGTRACARRPRYRETVWPPSRSAEAEPDGNHHPGERMAPSLQLDRSEVSRSHPAKSPAPAEVSRARGWHAWLPAASLDHPRAVSCALPPLRAAGRRRYPNPIHSDTSRRETAATPAGDSDTARRHWRKTPKPPWACVMGVTPRIQPAGERRLSRSHHASSTPAKGEDLRARSTHAITGEPSDGPPESAPRLRMGTPARRIRSQGPHHLPHREEEQDPLHPRCLPPMRPAGPEETSRPLAFAGHRRREQAPFGVPIRPAGGRDKPYLYPGTVLSTACEQTVEDP